MINAYGPTETTVCADPTEAKHTRPGAHNHHLLAVRLRTLVFMFWTVFSRSLLRLGLLGSFTYRELVLRGAILGGLG